MEESYKLCQTTLTDLTCNLYQNTNHRENSKLKLNTSVQIIDFILIILCVIQHFAGLFSVAFPAFELVAYRG